MTTIPDWLKVGATVGTFRDGPIPMARAATVERIGKRDVVLSDGQRFNVAKLHRTDGTWSYPTRVAPLDDPRFQRVRTKARRLNVGRQLERIAQQLREPDADVTALCTEAAALVEALSKSES